MIEVLTRWTGQNMSGGMVSVMNFANSPGAELTRSALSEFWTAIGGYLAQTTTWTIETTGRDFEASTGQTTGLWTDTVQYTGSGSGSGGSAVANATMGLIQWRTGSYRNGREVRGRTFIPGIRGAFLEGGEMAPAARSAIQTAAEDLLDSSAQLMIFSRPKSGTSGTGTPVVAANVWSEFAVLRSRRD